MYGYILKHSLCVLRQKNKIWISLIIKFISTERLHRWFQKYSDVKNWNERFDVTLIFLLGTCIRTSWFTRSTWCEDTWGSKYTTKSFKYYINLVFSFSIVLYYSLPICRISKIFNIRIPTKFPKECSCIFKVIVY